MNLPGLTDVTCVVIPKNNKTIQQKMRKNRNKECIFLPNEAPSNNKFPSVIVNKPVAKPAAAIHKLAMGTYLKIFGICS